MEFVAGAVTEAKRRYDDPLLIVAGDYNQWVIEDHLLDFPDLKEHNDGPTRGDLKIDWIFSNVDGGEASGTVPVWRTQGL